MSVSDEAALQTNGHAACWGLVWSDDDKSIAIRSWRAPNLLGAQSAGTMLLHNNSIYHIQNER